MWDPVIIKMQNDWRDVSKVLTSNNSAECISFLMKHFWGDSFSLLAVVGTLPPPTDQSNRPKPSAWPCIVLRMSICTALSLCLSPVATKYRLKFRKKVSGVHRSTEHSVICKKTKNGNTHTLPIAVSKLGKSADRKEEDKHQLWHIYSHSASCLQESVQRLVNLGSLSDCAEGNQYETKADEWSF